MRETDNIVRCWVDDAIESVSKKGTAAPDRDVLLAAIGIITRDMLKQLASLRWPLWFAGAMVGGSAAVQVVLKILGG